MNYTTLMGRLTATPELKHTQNGNIPYCKFSIAVDKPYKSGEDRKADFILVTAWRSTAEFLCKYFTKGQMIGVHGSLATSSYEKDGQKHFKMEVQADKLHFAGGSKSNSGTQTAEGATFDDSSGLTAEDFDEILGDGDMPF